MIGPGVHRGQFKPLKIILTVLIFIVGLGIFYLVRPAEVRPVAAPVVSPKQNNATSKDDPISFTETYPPNSWTAPAKPSAPPEANPTTATNAITPEHLKAIHSLESRLNEPGMNLEVLLATPEAQSLPEQARQKIVEDVINKLNSGELNPNDVLPGYREQTRRR